MKRTSLDRVLLLSLAVLVGRCSFGTSSEIKDGLSMESFINGIQELAYALENYGASCPQGNLSQDLEKSVSWSERHFQLLWEGIEGLEAEVENATKMTEEFLASSYSTAPPKEHEGCTGLYSIVAGHCLWLHKSPAHAWSDARKRCQRDGADLVTLDQFSDIISYLNRELGRTWTPVWFGGLINDRRSVKRIDTDEVVTVPESSWYTNRVGGSCAAFHGGKGHLVTSWDCIDEGYFLCEKKL